MSVVLSVEDVGPCRKQLTVEVPAPAVEAETQRIVREFGRQARVPGFRKGKVPARVVHQRYREDIERELVERLVSRYWHQAEAESQLKPILPPHLESFDLQEGTALTFVATVEIHPEVKLGNLEEFDLPEIPLEPGPDEVDEALEQARMRVADWVPVERPASRGDLVSLRITDLQEDASDEPQSVEIELGEPGSWEELSLAVTGLKEGQETEFGHRQEADGQERERRYSAFVLGVKEREPPPLDDDLARSIGGFSTLEELRAEIHRQLKASRKVERRQQREKALRNQLRERHPLQLPEGVVEHEAQRLLREYAESLKNRGIDLESSNLDWQSLAQEARPQAEARVHERLLLDAAAESLGLRVAEEELESMLATIAKAQKQTTVAVRQELDRSGRLGTLRAQMLRDKTIRHLVGDKESPFGETQGEEAPSVEGQEDSGPPRTEDQGPE